jgi:hypothetical protein
LFRRQTTPATQVKRGTNGPAVKTFVTLCI